MRRGAGNSVWWKGGPACFKIPGMHNALQVDSRYMSPPQIVRVLCVCCCRVLLSLLLLRQARRVGRAPVAGSQSTWNVLFFHRYLFRSLQLARRQLARAHCTKILKTNLIFLVKYVVLIQLYTSQLILLVLITLKKGHGDTLTPHPFSFFKSRDTDFQ